MSRELKPQKVGDYRHEKRGVTVELFLNRNTHEFYFDYQHQRYTKPALSDLKHCAREVIEAGTSLTWVPMITVEKLEPFARTDDTFVGFTVDRSWIAQKANGRWLEANWGDEVDSADMMRDREHWARSFYVDHRVTAFALPHYGDNTYHLPYSVPLWEGLQTVLAHIRALRTSLHHLLTTPEGHQRVAQAAGKRLSASVMLALPPSPEPTPSTPKAKRRKKETKR